MSTNIMSFDGGHRAVVQFDPDIGLFRGDSVGLNGGADFCADSVEGLRRDGETSLRIFLEICREKGIEPSRPFSGKFQVRISEDLHARAVDTAAARGTSLNRLVETALDDEIAG